MVVSMLPTQISAGIANESSAEDGSRDILEQEKSYSEILDITGWSCPDYKRSGWHWPFAGEYIFTVELPEGYACDPMPKVKVVLGGISVMTINDRHTVGGLVYKEITPETVQLIGLENDSFNKKLIVPAEITAGEKTFEVTGIGNEAFYGTDITGLDLSGANNLLYIGDFAFGNNRNITGLDLSTAKNLEYIGNSAFTMCSSLKGKVWIPESVTEIGDNSFSACGITGLDLSTAKNLQRIEFSAFANCYSLAGTVVIPESVTKIGDKVFFNCAITDLKLSKAANLQYIGNYAFQKCNALKEM